MLYVCCRHLALMTTAVKKKKDLASLFSKSNSERHCENNSKKSQKIAFN